MLNQLHYYISRVTDPYHNLAVEEYLLHNVKEGECILYLWQNEHTVVIGRNQNAWNECKTNDLKEAGGHLARRLSGGGAVYHDLGNLNFTFLVREEDYDVTRQTSVILDAVQKLGIHAEMSGRNDLTIDGHKFSGHAYYRTNGHCYHHGTLMVQVDRSMLSRFLNVSKTKLEKKGVASVQSHVVNLTEYAPSLSINALKQHLINSFGTVYGHTPTELPEDSIDQAQIKKREERFGSWDWQFGSNIHFEETVDGHFPWGELQIGYQIKNGHMQNVALYSDGLYADYLASLPSALEGCRYDPDEIAAALAKTVDDTTPDAETVQKRIIQSDISALLRSQFA
jgi:lipoate-protein ligase A